MVDRMRTRLTDRPIASAAGALSPVVRTIRPTRVLRKPQAMTIAAAMPTKNSGLTRSATDSAGSPVQSASAIAGRRGACGWMNGLPKKNARPVPSVIIAMPTAMSFTLGSEHSAPCIAPSATPAPPPASTPSHADPVRKAVA